MPSLINRQTEVDFPNRKRKDGLQWPWHHFQIASWVLYLYLGITAFGFIIPLLPCSWQSTGYSILGILFSGHFVFHVLTISIDPSSLDPNVEAKKTKPEKMHCHIIPVTLYKEKTRFCHICEKNVFNFDHHSRILNTCVGGRNFWFYMNCIITAFLGTASLTIMSLFVFSMYHSPWVTIDLSNSWFIISPETSTEIRAVVILIISFLDGILSLVITSVLGYHICFHLYLLSRGLTTQEYCEHLVLKKRLVQHHMGSRDLESAHPYHYPYLSILSLSRKSHLYLRDTAIQAEQTSKENANVTTQTNEEGRFLQETGSQTENEKRARQSSSSLTGLVERLQTPFKLSRIA
ncbi:palmitoyltransferase ZDHHC1-like [Rhinoderma darwinii]|uniref:palmitoyltransferase ZDHHC1-like n=1 Tax=Rhinoderma darwinii TaxID=43563 RepID=UPI003F66CFCA